MRQLNPSLYPQSYLSQDPGWTPSLGAVTDEFSMVDLLKMSGVVTTLA
jgi:hypothetical protein